MKKKSALRRLAATAPVGTMPRIETREEVVTVRGTRTKRTIQTVSFVPVAEAKKRRFFGMNNPILHPSPRTSSGKSNGHAGFGNIPSSVVIKASSDHDDIRSHNLRHSGKKCQVCGASALPDSGYCYTHKED